MQKIFELALQKHQQGQFSEALALYDQVLSQLATNDTVWNFSAIAAKMLGKAEDAAKRLEKAIQLNPQEAEYQLNLGHIYFEEKKLAAAEKAYSKACELNPNKAAHWYYWGNCLRDLGEKQQAFSCYEKAIELQPDYKECYGNSMGVLLESRQLEQLPSLIEKAATLVGVNLASELLHLGWGAQAYTSLMVCVKNLQQLYPQEAEYHFHEGLAWLQWREPEQALASFQQGVNISPYHASCGLFAMLLLALQGDSDTAKKQWQKLHRVIGAKEKLEQYVLIFRDTITSLEGLDKIYRFSHEIVPDSPRFLELISDIAQTRGRFEEAVLLLREAVALMPNHAGYLLKLSSAEMNAGIGGDAMKTLNEALALEPENYSALINQAVLLEERGRAGEALELLKKAHELQPLAPEAIGNLALLYSRSGNLAEAKKTFEKGIKNDPTNGKLIAAYGQLLCRMGDMDEGHANFNKAIELDPHDQQIHGGRVMQMLYSHRFTPQEISTAHFAFGDAMDYSVRQQKRPRRAITHKTPLRLGIVSGDFREHSCANFLFPLFDEHQPSELEITCYATLRAADSWTRRLMNKATNWHMVAGVGDDMLADKVAEDGIDILMDIAGTTSGNRLGLFARRAAPVQCTWLGYPYTTGIVEMDYRITDGVVDPAGSDSLYREKLVRLPSVFICYGQPLASPEPAVDMVASRTQVHFGCFNNLSKITPKVLELWIKILQQVPDSLLILKTVQMGDEKTMERFNFVARQMGLDPNRLKCFKNFEYKYDHFHSYGEIDISLDPFPYNGTTTTCEALWMGVPVIALEGGVHLSRVSMNLLRCVGLEELIAKNEDDYLEKAVDLGKDRARLVHYRQHIRQKMLASPLMDAKNFSQEMTEALKNMNENMS